MDIHSVQDFEDFFERELKWAFSTGVHILYRGHGLNSNSNCPTICRYGLNPDEILMFDKILLDKLKDAKDSNGFIGSVKLHPGFGTKGHFNDWLILTQARHLEMPSRLQDWSMRWEIALYFAVSNTSQHNEAGHMWLLQSPMHFAKSNDPKFDEDLKSMFLHLGAGDKDMSVLDGIDPFDIQKTMLLHYPHYSEEWLLQIGEVRRGAQGGKFIVSKQSAINTPLEKQFVGRVMARVEIPSSAKSGILEELIKRNFHEKTVLPAIPDDTKAILEGIKSSALSEIKFQRNR